MRELLNFLGRNFSAARSRFVLARGIGLAISALNRVCKNAGLARSHAKGPRSHERGWKGAYEAVHAMLSIQL